MDRTGRLHPLVPSLLVGTLAGLASAFIHSGPVTSGTGLSVFLAFFAPLPMFVAGLGWGLAASVTACVSSFAGLLVALSLGNVPVDSPAMLGTLYFLSIAGPAALLCHLGLLARPGSLTSSSGGPPSPETWEWFPAGRLAVWLAALSVVLFLGLEIFGPGEGGLKGHFVHTLGMMAPDGSELRQVIMTFFPKVGWERAVQILAAVFPAAIGISWQIMLAANGLIAEQVLRASNRTIRPKLDLMSLTLPRFLAGALAISLALAFAGGRLGFVAGTIASLLYVPYFFLGLTVVHAIPARGAGRVVLLAFFYFLVLLVSWLSIAVGMLGLVQQWADLRARFVAAAAAREDK